MRTFILGLFLGIGMLCQAQFFGNAGKSMVMVGATFAKENTGLYFGYEEQIGDYISIGLNPIILLGNQSYSYIDENEEVKEKDLKFGKKFDLKAKMSIHFSEVLKIDKFDFYPGLNIGFHNLGLHAGAQMYLATGFAAFGEANFAIAKYDDDSPTSFNKAYYSFGLAIDL